MAKNLVLIGAGHAHVVTVHALSEYISRGHQVTVVGPSPYHYYSGMGPGVLGSSYTAEQIRFNIQQVVEEAGARFVQDEVVHIDPQKRNLKLLSGSELSYDIVSCNCGSTIRDSQDITLSCPYYSVKPIENLVAARSHIIAHGKNRQLQVGIIGGGASAAELAGNLLQLTQVEKLTTPRVMVFCRSRFMNRFPEQVQKACREYLTGAGVEIMENDPVVSGRENTLTTASGTEEIIDIAFSAQGVMPSSLFRKSGMSIGPDGGLKVNSFLQSIDHPEIFGGGDCIYYLPQPLDKVGVYAVRQNHVLHHNLMAALEGQELKEFSSGGGYLLIFNLGNGYGVLKKGFWFLKGRLAFKIKDYIDCRFMNTFQKV